MPSCDCKYWVTYDSVAGDVSYCEVAAHSLRVTPEQLRAAGCTPERRQTCMRSMQLSTGIAPQELEVFGVPGSERLAPAAASGLAGVAADARPAAAVATAAAAASAAVQSAPAITSTQAVATPTEVAATVLQTAEAQGAEHLGAAGYPGSPSGSLHRLRGAVVHGGNE